VPELPFLRDLVVLLLLSLAIVLVFQRLRQPPVVGFLAAGVLFGPHGLSLVHDVHQVELLAEVGVILLLFTLGLEFSLSALAQLRRQVFLGGGLQVLLTMLVAAPLGLLVGGWRQALLIGAMVSLSSTVIVLKLLADRSELDAPHGRAALGILLWQDLLVIPMMLGVQFLAGEGGTGPGGGTAASLLGGLAIMAGIIVAARWVVPRLLAEVVRTRRRELFVLTILLVCLGTAWATSRVGLSLALGAFLAGVAVSESEYGAQALADVLPLRDTFASLFFISIGMLFDPRSVMRHPLLLPGATAAVLALKLATGMGAVYALGIGLSAAGRGGFALAQVGEFSFVLAQVGRAAGVLDPGLYQIFLGVAVSTMLVTPFLVAASGPAAEGIASLRLPGWLRRGAPPPTPVAPLGNHVVIAGFGLNGRNLARVLQACEIPYAVLETNPETVWAARAAGEPIVYGDVSRREVLEHLLLERARALVLAISDPPSTRRAVAVARAGWPHLVIIARTRYLSEVEPLHRAGANEVVPEEFETSIEIFAKVLAAYDVPHTMITQQIDRVRAEHYAVWRESDVQAHRLGRLSSMLAGLDVDTYRILETSPVRGKSLGELNLRRVSGATVIARVRDGVTLAAPGGDTPVEAGDVLVLLGTNAQVERARAALEGRVAEAEPMEAPPGP
jgi:CPA2 family monovalent cation:H+ antiporter-2